MPLLDYISGSEDDRRSDLERFLSDHWDHVLAEAPVLKRRYTLKSDSWSPKSFSVEDVEVGSEIRAKFRFKAVGFDQSNRSTGEEINGSAVVLIDDVDNIEFTDVVVVDD